MQLLMLAGEHCAVSAKMPCAAAGRGHDKKTNLETKKQTKTWKQTNRSNNTNGSIVRLKINGSLLTGTHTAAGLLRSHAGISSSRGDAED